MKTINFCSSCYKVTRSNCEDFTISTGLPDGSYTAIIESKSKHLESASIEVMGGGFLFTLTDFPSSYFNPINNYYLILSNDGSVEGAQELVIDEMDYQCVEIDFCDHCCTQFSGEMAMIADFSATNLTPEIGEVIRFDDLSTGSPTNWLWSFGDGITSTEQNPTHTYATAESFDVTLNVWNSESAGIKEELAYITSSNVPEKMYKVATNKYIDTNVDYAIDWNTPFTWFARVKKRTPSFQQFIAGNFDGTSGVYVGVNVANKVTVQIRSSFEDRIFATSVNTVSIGSNQLITVIYDGSGNGIGVQILIDDCRSDLVISMDTLGTNAITTTNNFKIGQLGNGTEFFDGDFAYWKMHGRAVSIVEVMKEWNEGAITLAPQIGTPLHSYPMNDDVWGSSDFTIKNIGSAGMAGTSVNIVEADFVAYIP